MRTANGVYLLELLLYSGLSKGGMICMKGRYFEIDGENVEHSGVCEQLYHCITKVTCMNECLKQCL